MQDQSQFDTDAKRVHGEASCHLTLVHDGVSSCLNKHHCLRSDAAAIGDGRIDMRPNLTIKDTCMKFFCVWMKDYVY